MNESKVQITTIDLYWNTKIKGAGGLIMSKYYTSCEFAKKARVSIRYYDQRNLLKPATHIKGIVRLYIDYKIYFKQ